MGNKEPEAILWHTNREMQNTEHERRQYHIAIVDGNERIDTIVNYLPADKSLQIEPYLHWEYDYTVHDFCDHDDDYCCLEDEESREGSEAYIESMYSLRVKQVGNCEVVLDWRLVMELERLAPGIKMSDLINKHALPALIAGIKLKSTNKPSEMISKWNESIKQLEN